MKQTASRGRPQGEIRQAIFDTLRAQGAMPQRDIAERTQVGLDACRSTIENAVRAGQLEIVGREKRLHCKQLVALYWFLILGQPNDWDRWSFVLWLLSHLLSLVSVVPPL